METKEKVNVVYEIQQQKEVIMKINSITERILGVVRGNMPEECESVMEENCMMDTILNNKKGLARLEKNINELADKLIG